VKSGYVQHGHLLIFLDGQFAKLLFIASIKIYFYSFFGFELINTLLRFHTDSEKMPCRISADKPSFETMFHFHATGQP
jgi:hypothetical protein